jgi:hypothetical protein
VAGALRLLPARRPLAALPCALARAPPPAAGKQKRLFKKFTYRGVDLDKLLDMSAADVRGRRRGRARQRALEPPAPPRARRARAWQAAPVPPCSMRRWWSCCRRASAGALPRA